REGLHVRILNVPAVFAQVDGDAVGPSGQRVGRGADGVGLVGAPCFTEGRDVIDVDVEAHGFLPSVQLMERAAPVNRRSLVVLSLIAAACHGYQAGELPEPKNPTTALTQFL